MRPHLFVLALAAALLCALVVSPGQAQAQISAPLEIVLSDLEGNVITTLEGTFEITRFVARRGGLFAVGNFILENGASVPLILPVLLGDEGGTTGTCDVLNLVLGPIHLDLLGLVVDTNQIEVNITAESGPGNLLGNLLCRVAGLLDGGGNLRNLAFLLNLINQLVEPPA